MVDLRMFRTVVGIALFFTCSGFGVEPTAYEQSVLTELNQARTNPPSLIVALQELYRRMDGKFLFASPILRIETQEGAAAITEAMGELKKIKPASAFEYSKILSLAARDHQIEQSRTGQIGHYSANGNGPTERALKYVILRGKSGENISYGDYGVEGPRSVPVAFIVDDGVPERGHRRNLFDPLFRKVGIACGPHPKYQRMCVVDFAFDLKANGKP